VQEPDKFQVQCVDAWGQPTINQFLFSCQGAKCDTTAENACKAACTGSGFTAGQCKAQSETCTSGGPAADNYCNGLVTGTKCCCTTNTNNACNTACTGGGYSGGECKIGSTCSISGGPTADNYCNGLVSGAKCCCNGQATGGCDLGTCCKVGDTTCNMQCGGVSKPLNCKSNGPIQSCEYKNGNYYITCTNGESAWQPCVTPTCGGGTGTCKDSTKDTTYLCSGAKGCAGTNMATGVCWKDVCKNNHNYIYRCDASGACVDNGKACPSGCNAEGTDCAPDTTQCKDSTKNAGYMCSGKTGCQSPVTGAVCWVDQCKNNHNYVYRCDLTTGECKDTGTVCANGCNDLGTGCKPDPTQCKIITPVAPHAPTCDDGSGNPLENYCKCDAGGCKEYNYGCDGNGKCVLSTGSACGADGCEDAVVHNSGNSWSHRCKTGTGTRAMTIKVDPMWETTNEYVKRGFWRSCQAIRSVKVEVWDPKTNNLIEDRGITIDFSTSLGSPPFTCITDGNQPSCSSKVGVAYFQQNFGTFTTETKVTLTAVGTDNSGKANPYAKATGTAQVTVKPNKLKISFQDAAIPYYGYSKATNKNEVRSCEPIKLCAKVLDADDKVVLKAVEVSFKLVVDNRADNNKKCTIDAGKDSCCVEYTAPPVKTQTTFKVEVTATSADCYAPADKVTSDLIVKTNQLKLSPYTSPKSYVWSTATTKGEAKSCEDITFGACILDEDAKTVTKEVTVTFQFTDDDLKAPQTCKIAPSANCCTVKYKAPANPGASAKDFHVKVNATDGECYLDADPVPGTNGGLTPTLNVVPVKLVLKDLKVSPTTVKSGEEVEASCTIVDSIESKPVAGAVASLNLTQSSGTPNFPGKGGPTAADGIAKTVPKIKPTTAGTYTLYAAATVPAVSPSKLSCYADSVKTPGPTVVVTSSTCAEACAAKGKGSTGCIAIGATCGGQSGGETSDCTGKICCCKA
jgi:hypothetical protein